MFGGQAFCNVAAVYRHNYRLNLNHFQHSSRQASSQKLIHQSLCHYNYGRLVRTDSKKSSK